MNPCTKTVLINYMCNIFGTGSTLRAKICLIQYWTENFEMDFAAVSLTYLGFIWADVTSTKSCNLIPKVIFSNIFKQIYLVFVNFFQSLLVKDLESYAWSLVFI